MSVAEKIEKLRQDFPHCRAVTFFDLSTGLVLYASAREKLRQERLDRLSEQARLLLGPASPLGGLIDGDAPESVTIAKQDVTLMCVRSPTDDAEGLAFECDPGADVAPLLARARRELADIGEAA